MLQVNSRKVVLVTYRWYMEYEADIHESIVVEIDELEDLQFRFHDRFSPENGRTLLEEEMRQLVACGELELSEDGFGEETCRFKVINAYVFENGAIALWDGDIFDKGEIKSKEDPANLVLYNRERDFPFS